MSRVTDEVKYTIEVVSTILIVLGIIVAYFLIF